MRCQVLAVAALVIGQHRDVYEITRWELYLEDEVDAQNQPTLRPGRIL